MQKWIRDITVEKYMAQLKVGLKIDRKMKIASIGSCFAREIRQYLLANDYNYLLVEQDKNPWIPIDARYKPNEHGSAAWDRVFNTYTFRDIVDTSFGRVTSRLHETSKGVADLIRTRVMYSDRQTAEVDVADHIKRSAGVFGEADLLILTLGLTEVWEYDGLVLPYKPEYIESSELTFKRTNLTDNLHNLRIAWSILKKNNPNLKMLITLSPST